MCETDHWSDGADIPLRNMSRANRVKSVVEEPEYEDMENATANKINNCNNHSEKEAFIGEAAHTSLASL